jgi:ABC-type Fe3+/spermidine/putrescine transport system ATPase subunit
MDSPPLGATILEVEGATRRFGEVTAVDRLSLGLDRGEFLTLLGPSGCGKTTALRLIAGFERPDAGRVRFDGADVTEWSPQRRGFGMVFQNYALFPHLNVFENVAFGLRSRKRPPAEIQKRVGEALARVDLEGYGDRAVQALSGGQQQRVALARALAIEPPLLLLDEPLSNLDQALRVRTRTELRALVRELGITAVFVTHDQEEAFDLSDRIAVMEAGRLRQVGTPRELYHSPADRFVAGFVGRVNELPVTATDEGLRLPGKVRWPLPADAGLRGPALLLVRPEALALEPEGTPDGLRGRVTDRRFQGAVTLFRVEVQGGEAPLTLEVVVAGDGPDVGAPVSVRPGDGSGLHLFPPSAGLDEAP